MTPVLDKLAEKYNLQLNREQAVVAKVTCTSFGKVCWLDMFCFSSEFLSRLPSLKFILTKCNILIVVVVRY